MTKKAEEQASSESWLGGLIGICIVLYIIHWLVSGFLAGITFKECKEDTSDYYKPVCDCRKSAMRDTLIVEYLVIDSVSGKEDHRSDTRKAFYSIYESCPSRNT